MAGFFDWLTGSLGGQFLYPLDYYGRPVAGGQAPPAAYALSRRVVSAVGANTALQAAKRIANGSGKPVVVPWDGRNVLVSPQRTLPFAFTRRHPVALPAQVRGAYSSDVKGLMQRGPLTDAQIRRLRSLEAHVGGEITGDAIYKKDAGAPIKVISPASGNAGAVEKAKVATAQAVQRAAYQGRSLSTGEVSDAYKLFRFCFSFNFNQ